MAEKRNRWLINIVLVLSILGFMAISFGPSLASMFSSITKGNSDAKASPSPAATTEAKKADIESQARGYEEILKREPENQTALRGLLESRLRLNDVKGVVEPLEKLSKLNPTMTEYSVLLAQAKQQLGDREGSAQVYRTILQSRPGDLSALTGLVDLLVKQQRPESAIKLLQDTLKQAPTANKNQAGSVDTTAIQVLLGKVYANQKRYDEALTTFDEASKTNANDFQPVLYKAMVLKEQGKASEAKPLFEKATSLAPAQYKDQIARMGSSESPAPNPASSAVPVPATQTPKNGAPSQSSSPKPETVPQPGNAPAAAPKN